MQAAKFASTLNLETLKGNTDSMKPIWMPLRSVVIVAVIFTALFASFGSAGAQAASHAARHPAGAASKVNPAGNGNTRLPPGFNDPNLPKATFIGLITSVDSPNGVDPNDFTLELGIVSEVIRLSQTTMITGKTAEAVVEGLASGDYAVVRAKRFKGSWYAIRVVFDVQPLPPLRLISGTIVRITKDLRHFVLKPDTGKGNLLVRLMRQTRFHVDGRPVDGPPPSQWIFGPTTIAIQVLLRRDVGAWSAFDIYMRSTS
jgi:hypothetical protein